MEPLFAGIDPGQTGGLGIIDHQGKYLTAVRWNAADPRRLYNILLENKYILVVVYLEDVNLPSKPGAGLQDKWTGSGNLLVNLGIWQGWLIGLGIKFNLIAPASWQAHHDLFRYQKKILAGDLAQQTPLMRAQEIWPAAPLEFKADDGKAVGLLLAAMALDDHRKGIDRGALRQAADQKAKHKRRVKKQIQNLPW